MFLLTLALACGTSTSFDLSGVWRFEVAVTPTPEDTCSERFLHNVNDALEDGDGDTGDPGDDGWDQDSDATLSPQTMLGRFTSDGDSWLLVVDGEMLPQEEGGDASAPTFAWERAEYARTETSHASGYRYVAENDDTAVTRVQIQLPNELQQKDARRTGSPVSLEGSWSQSQTSTASWEEADLWPEELGLGDTGSIPLSSYLTRLDELGYVVAVTNQRETTDCTDTSCVLTVTSTCSESWDITATQTGIDPSEEGWQDLEWAAGN